MGIFKLKRFSSEKRIDLNEADNERKKTRKKLRNVALGGGAAILVGNTAECLAWQDAAEKERENSKISNELRQRFEEDKKRLNIEQHEHNNVNSAFLKGNPKRAKLLKKYPKIDEWLGKKLENEGKEAGLDITAPGGKLSNVINKNRIYISKTGSSPSVIAHELGHAEHQIKGGKGSLIGKGAHKLYGLPTGKIGIVDGFIRGKNSVKTDEDTGDIVIDKSKLKKSAGIGALLSAPVLISEAAASRRGIKTLKSAGLKGEELRRAKRTLGHAWGSYATARGGGNVLSETTGHLVGNIYGIKREKKKGEKK